MPKPTRKKILSFLGMTVGGIIIGLVISFYLMLSLSVAPTSGKIQLPHLNSEVEIVFDKMGIPQIYADDEHDAMFALGYQHAADRMFQMDLARRLASGKLSEMLGSMTNEVDKEQRRIGHLRLAKKALPNLSEQNRLLMQAYCDGINSYRISCRAMPFEYRFLPIDFEEWTLIDCLALVSFQTWFSNSLMNRDDFYRKMVDRVGWEKGASLMYQYPDYAPTTVNNKSSVTHKDHAVPGNSYNFNLKLSANSNSSRAQKEIANSLFSSNIMPFTLTHASNAWVLDPNRSKSNRAVLASDPHLEIGRLPQFWYAVGVHVKNSYDVFGITAPGLPFVIMGHNAEAAWAFTAGGTDVTDYIKVQLNQSDQNEYLDEAGYTKFNIHLDTIYSAGSDSLMTIETQTCDLGVLMESDNHEAMLLRWVGHEVDLNQTVTSGLTLPMIDSYKKFQTTVAGFGALDANMLYADSSGNIGYQLTTPIPKRNEKQNLPLDYPDKKSWAGILPLNKTPQTLNPDIGWIASCNNLPMHSADLSGYYFYNRILRINHLLSSKEKFSTDDMMNFQFDRTDFYLMRFREYISRTLAEIGQTDLAVMIKNWDGTTGLDSRETALVNVFLDELKAAIFKDELGDMYAQIPIGWLDRLDDLNEAGWFDDITTDETETLEQISQSTMKRTVALVGDKSWGELQTLSMQHPLAIIPVIGSMLNLATPGEPYPGTPGSLNASFFSRTDSLSFRSLAAPSMRFLVDFADADQTSIVLPAGNSGNPMSDHFMDFHEMWKNNERWTVPFTKEKIIEQAASNLILQPMND